MRQTPRNNPRKFSPPMVSGRWIGLILGLTVIVTIWCGLDPRKYRFHNEVSWVEGGPGIRFGPFGRAETDPLITANQAESLNRGGFSLEILAAPAPDVEGFRVLAVIHAGEDRSQFLIGKWQDQIIVMNGDDYNAHLGIPRITSRFATNAGGGGNLRLTVTTGDGGTSVYVNQEPVTGKPALRLKLPAGPQPGRLILGNSLRADRPWVGELFNFALHAGVLDPAEIRNRHQEWLNSGSFSTATSNTPVLLYAFDSGRGRSIESRGSLKIPLRLPKLPTALGHRALALSWGDRDASLLGDSLINFLGFMPFGAALATVLYAAGHGARRTRWMATAFSFLLSLGLELAQAWIPSRDSSLRDLLLNTAGAFAAAWLTTAIATRLTTASAGSSRAQ